MKKILFTIITVCSLAIVLQAQHASQYTNFMFNKLAYNPAYAGSNEVLTMSALYRNQWEGFAGAPETVNFNMHTPFFKNKCGIGLSVVSDRIGILNTNHINLSYNYRLKLDEKHTLSAGIMGRLEHGSVNWNEVDAIDNDQMIGMLDGDRLQPNFGMGLYLNHDRYYVGLSAPQLLRNSLYTNLDNSDDVRSYYLMGGFVAELSKDVKVKPAVLFSYNPSAPFEVELNTNFIFMDVLWLGASYRMGDSFDAIMAYQLSSQLRAGVAVDFTITELRKCTSGSFEVMLQYALQHETEGVKNIRYF